MCLDGLSKALDVITIGFQENIVFDTCIPQIVWENSVDNGIFIANACGVCAFWYCESWCTRRATPKTHAVPKGLTGVSMS